MVKVCMICGREFVDRPVYNTCRECRDDFRREMSVVLDSVLGVE